MTWLVLAVPATAQEFAALARLEMGGSQIVDTETGVEIRLRLSQVVPWRVVTLDDPKRLILDFREVDFSAASSASLLNADGVAAVRFGAFRPGWSRLVLDLPRPLGVSAAGMAVDETTGKARLTVSLEPVSAAAFAARTGAPELPGWELPAPLANAPTIRPRDARPLMVAIDPGHGGVDPGAERDGVREADLMLRLALELAEQLRREPKFDVVLTRRADEFVALEARLTRARAQGAQVFLSLHADALEEGVTQGASVYTLSDEASDAATRKMAERHSRGDLLAGLDLSGQDDSVATALMEMVRRETVPRSEALAVALVDGMAGGGVPLHARPLRRGDIAVLRSADMPSALVEVGFLSDASDSARLTSAAGRAQVVAGIVGGLLAWEAADLAAAALLRR